MLNKNLANDVAKLRIRKEKDFNITEFFRISCTFLEDNSCDFIRNHFFALSKHKKLQKMML